MHSVKAAQSELNESELHTNARTHEGTNARTHERRPSRDLLKFIYTPVDARWWSHMSSDTDGWLRPGIKGRPCRIGDSHSVTTEHDVLTAQPSCPLFAPASDGMGSSTRRRRCLCAIYQRVEHVEKRHQYDEDETQCRCPAQRRLRFP